MLVSIAVFNVTLYVPFHTNAATAHMMLFWDPASGSVPSGWTLVTTYDGRFPRGESVANFGLTGANDTPRTPTTSSATFSGPSSVENGNGGTLVTVASTTHTHPAPTVTLGADSNSDLPVYRSLQLITNNTGIPNIIPAGAIIMFDTTGSVPSGFTRLSAQDNNMIRVNSTVATGGSDTATNSVAVGALAASVDPTSTGTTGNGGNNYAAPAHTHAAATSDNTASFSTVPPYVQPLLAQANSNTSTLSIAITAMFDADPGNGWIVESNSGGSYYQQFLRPASTASLTSQGAATHTPAAYTVTSGASATATAGKSKGNGGVNGASQLHTHQITVNFNSVSNLPPWFNVVIAQKISFTLQAYRWYVEPNSENVTDPWPAGTLDIAQNTILPAIPVPYLAPINTNQLRLRMQILLSGQALPASNTQYKLQFKQGSDGSCTTGSWTDLGGGVAWNYGTNSVTDGTQLTVSKLSPASSVLQRFSKSAAAGTNPNAVAVGQTMEYDFLINASTVLDGSQYSFRILEDNGTLLSVYTACPSLVTRPQISQELRHGEFFQDGADQGFAWSD